MEMNKKNRHHQFYLPWYAADEEVDNWITYLHRNLHHLEGENYPFQASEWHFDQDDAFLHDEVLDALYKSDKVDASCISIIVLNGTVSLTGLVSDEEERVQAENVVRGIEKVWSVINELVIRDANVQYHS
jgi:hypothetical protein